MASLVKEQNESIETKPKIFMADGDADGPDFEFGPCLAGLELQSGR